LLKKAYNEFLKNKKLLQLKVYNNINNI